MGAFVRISQVKTHNKQDAQRPSLPEKAKVNKPDFSRVQFVESKIQHQTSACNGNDGKCPPALSREERSNMWWSKDEFKKIKRRNAIICACLKNGCERKMRELEKSGHCYRGLELHFDRIRRKHRQEHLEAVTDLQGAQHLLDELNTKRIRRIMSERSAASTIHAAVIAQSDAIESFNTCFLMKN